MTSRRCRVCNREPPFISSSLDLCLDCIREEYDKSEPLIVEAHARVRRKFGLPVVPPRTAGGVPCTLCANECTIGEEDRGYCGLRSYSDGVFTSVASPNSAALYYYLDPQVTNCCAAWFCPAGTGAGYPRFACRPGPEVGYYNLALFFYGCNFDCLYCQNASHKRFELAPRCDVNTLVSLTLENKRISCWCFFGGSPEPQLPFAISASKTMLDSKTESRVLRICFEWNGAGNRLLVDRAAQLALRSGGNIKFDLKCGSDTVSKALSGVSNRRSFENFEMLFRKYGSERPNMPLLTATTLLVPGYVDAIEVEKIAGFLADLDKDIPYSLLVFHPDFMMTDLPVTPSRQVEECYRSAKKHLARVNVGNLASLGIRSWPT
jgi:pyruvate formate lyase activating enzyme